MAVTTRDPTVRAHFSRMIEELGLTQAELAALLQVTQPEVSHWRTGTRGVPVRVFHRVRQLHAQKKASDYIARGNQQGSTSPSPCPGLMSLASRDVQTVLRHAETCP